MTDEQVKLLAEAINNLYEAIREIGSRLSGDEPLNYAVVRGLDKISEAIETHS